MNKLAGLWEFAGKHKYLITIVVFGIIIGFLDENSIVRRMQYTQEISVLNREIQRYRKEYEESTERLGELVATPSAIEQIARERYRMKKPDEDIYVFEVR